MVRVYVLVEGQTEETFVNTVLIPYLSMQEVHLYPRQIGRPRHRGGIGEYERAQRDILATLKQERNTFCTTMFDYYAMPSSWPGRATATGDPKAIERAILSDISAIMGEGFNCARLIPYVQMYEFEALLFSAPEVLARGLDLPKADDILRILAECHTPEEVNDSRQTAPSKRIEHLCPGYDHASDGPRIAERIGLDVMRARCPHFNEWIARLEALAGKIRKVE